jgi:UDP-N-acetylglucosamine 2-epimerase (non-hydrolysing)
MIAPKPKVAVVFGTRPEAIKMAPVIRELSGRSELQTLVISTGQHKQMLSQILGRFDIRVHYEMDLMEPNQSLFRLSSKVIAEFEKILTSEMPSMMLVQGDTTTAFLGALCAFYLKIPVGHVEAGLRTHDRYFPFPEEVNRRLITVCGQSHFCPTEQNRQNLLREGIPESDIHVTGNTGIDALLMATRISHPFPIAEIRAGLDRYVLVTAHRRESFGKPLVSIFNAIRELAGLYPEIKFIYPVHLNPNVQKPAHEILGGIRNVLLTAPMDYFDFVQLMKHAYLILTDSGGVQEEAPTLGVPVLVLRNETERPEAVQAGTVKLAGVDQEAIVREARSLLDDEGARQSMLRASNPYGDGRSSLRIGEILRSTLCRK